MFDHYWHGHTKTHLPAALTHGGAIFLLSSGLLYTTTRLRLMRDHVTPTVWSRTCNMCNNIRNILSAIKKDFDMTRLFLSMFVVLHVASLHADQPPKHLAAAESLVEHLRLRNTSYDHGDPRVTWDGVCQSHADCSGFIDALLMHSYGYTSDDFKRWFDWHRPRRAEILRRDRRGTRFSPDSAAGDVQPGDLLAVKYFKQSDNTGHVMLAAARPRHIVSSRPIVSGTEQWELTIIDRLALRPWDDGYAPSSRARRQRPRWTGPRHSSHLRHEARPDCRILLERGQEFEIRRRRLMKNWSSVG